MSANVEIVRAAFDAFNRGDLDEWLTFGHDDIVFSPAGVFPDFPGEFHGVDGMREFWRRLREPWTSLTATVGDVEEEGDTVTVLLSFDARAPDAPPVTLSLTASETAALQRLPRPRARRKHVRSSTAWLDSLTGI